MKDLIQIFNIYIICMANVCRHRFAYSIPNFYDTNVTYDGQTRWQYSFGNKTD